jgi:hypothetical protein
MWKTHIKIGALANYTLLTAKTTMKEPNVYAGRKEQILEGFSNTSPKLKS